MKLGRPQIRNSCRQSVPFDVTQNLSSGRQGSRPRNETWHAARDTETSGGQGHSSINRHAADDITTISSLICIDYDDSLALDFGR